MRRTKAEALKTREAVLKAAGQTIAQQGIGAFTLEAVAHAAGVTKGGVLHHFPTKEALMLGLIDQVIEAFNTRLVEALAAEPAGQPGRWLRAYIRTVFSVRYDDPHLLPALAAAVAADETTLQHIRRGFAVSHQAALQDGLDPTRATVIRLAVDGLVFARSLNVDVLDQPASQAVYDELMRLTATRS